MRTSISWLERQIACCLATLLVMLLVAFLGTPFAQAAATPLPPAPEPAETAAVQAQAASPLPAASQAAPASPPSSTPPPVGAAAAPYVKPGGVAASRPAGAAIAPAKQRRIRSIAIRVGLLVGAGIAIGVVVAASQGSPSRPH